MWRLFRRHLDNNVPWRAMMGWQVLTYREGGQSLSLQIEPMHDGACLVLLPGPKTWRETAPAWARDRRAQIQKRLRQLAWNRDLVWMEDVRAKFWPRSVLNPVPGSLQSTPGGRELERMWLFQPDCPKGWSRQDSKRAWFAATEQMCQCTAGPVTVSQTAIVPGSVVQALVLPALRRNPRVTLNLVPA